MIPNIKKYLNAHQYLHDYYKYRKEIDPTFSYEKWAIELKASDKSYVRMMVLGKRHINTQMTEAFASDLKLSDEDTIYFNYLVQYTQATTRTIRDTFGKKLISLISSELDQLDVQNHFEFLSNPLLPRLQVLLSFNDLEQTPDNLSLLLNVDSALVQEALEALVRLGIVTFREGRYSPLKRSFKVSDSFKNLGLESFYVQNLEDSKRAISLAAETRRYKSLFLPLTEIEFSEFWISLEEFTREKLARFNSDEYKDRRLYQTHFNIIPVTAKLPDRDTPTLEDVPHPNDD